MPYVWTDFGGVLTPPISESMAVFCRAYNLTLQSLYRAIHAVGRRHGVDDSMSLIDTGQMSERDWLRDLSAELGGALQIDTLADLWFADRPPNTVWVAHLREIRSQGVGVGLISNMVPTWDGYWQRMLNEPDLFDHVVLSFDVGSRKPERQIFDHAARVAGVGPSDCILVDDLAANCIGARAAGWQSIEFTTAESAASQLAALLTNS